jgi:hypothetical protein
MKKNLFIVASPLQFLNAIEAREYFKTSNNILILIYNSKLNQVDFEQKQNILIESDWDEIIEYDLGKIAKKKRFFEQVSLVKQLKKDSYEYLFSGDFGTIQQMIMSNVKVDQIYLLDDGTASIVIYKKLQDKDFFQNISFSKKMKLYRYFLMGLDYKIKQNINFFTIYNLQTLDHIKVIQHNFSYLKEHALKECKKTDSIYVLGQNIAEVGYIKEDVYLEYLHKIIEKFDGNIIYKPHRSEKITKAYESLISDRFFIDKDISQGPIEISLITNKIYPSIVISFFSSALFSLDKIFDDSLIYAIKIKEDDFIVEDKNIRNVIKSCYNFLESTSVKYIEI